MSKVANNVFNSSKLNDIQKALNSGSLTAKLKSLSVVGIDENLDVITDINGNFIGGESGGGSGDVNSSTSSSRDKAIVRFDGNTGKIIKGYTTNSLAPIVSDDGFMTVYNNFNQEREDASGLSVQSIYGDQPYYSGAMDFRSYSSKSNPDNISNNRVIGRVQFLGGSAPSNRYTGCRIQSKAIQNWTSTEQGSDFVIQTIKKDESIIEDRLKIDEDGDVQITNNLVAQDLYISGARQTILQPNDPNNPDDNSNEIIYTSQGVSVAGALSALNEKTTKLDTDGNIDADNFTQKVSNVISINAGNIISTATGEHDIAANTRFIVSAPDISLTGEVKASNINCVDGTIINVSDPTNLQDAATKNYVDDTINTLVNDDITPNITELENDVSALQDKTSMITDDNNVKLIITGDGSTFNIIPRGFTFMNSINPPDPLASFHYGGITVNGKNDTNEYPLIGWSTWSGGALSVGTPIKYFCRDKTMMELRNKGADVFAKFPEDVICDKNLLLNRLVITERYNPSFSGTSLGVINNALDGDITTSLTGSYIEINFTQMKNDYNGFLAIYGTTGQRYTFVYDSTDTYTPGEVNGWSFPLNIGLSRLTKVRINRSTASVINVFALGIFDGPNGNLIEYVMNPSQYILYPVATENYVTTGNLTIDGDIGRDTQKVPNIHCTNIFYTEENPILRATSNENVSIADTFNLISNKLETKIQEYETRISDLEDRLNSLVS